MNYTSELYVLLVALAVSGAWCLCDFIRPRVWKYQRQRIRRMRESLYAKPACSIATAREIAELAALLPRFNLLIPAENRDVFQEEATGLLELAVQRMGSEIEAMNADLASYLGERFSANEEEAHAYNTLYRATVIDQLTRQHCKYSREAAALVAIQRQQLHQQ